MLNIFSKKTQKKPSRELPEVARGVLAETKKENIPAEKPPEALPKLAKKPVQTEHITIAAPQIETGTIYPEPAKKDAGYYAEKEISDASFFSNLLSHLRKEESMIDAKYLNPDELNSRNLVAEMREYWNEQKKVFQQLRETEKLEQNLVANIEELQHLESEWQQLENELEERKKALKDKETQIENETLKLKELMRRWNLKKDTEEKHYFHLNTGNYCKNVMELLNALKKMDDASFNHHVTPEKNDFVLWINNVFNDKALAKELESASSKEKTIEILNKVLG